MNRDDAHRFGRILYGLASVFEAPMTAMKCDAYFEALRGFPIEVVESAAQHLAANTRFFPKPVEFREVIEGGTVDQLAMQAWMALTAAIPRAGAYAAILARNAAWAGAVLDAFGGWPEAVQARREMSEPSWQAKRKEFVVAFQRHSRLHAPEPLSYLSGLSDRSNGVGGREWSPEARDASRRRLVWVLDENWRLTSLMAPYDDSGRPALSDADWLLKQPPRPLRVLLPTPPDVTPLSKAAFEAQLTEALAKVSARAMVRGDVE